MKKVSKWQANKAAKASLGEGNKTPVQSKLTVGFRIMKESEVQLFKYRQVKMKFAPCTTSYAKTIFLFSWSYASCSYCWATASSIEVSSKSIAGPNPNLNLMKKIVMLIIKSKINHINKTLVKLVDIKFMRLILKKSKINRQIIMLDSLTEILYFQIEK